MSRKYLGIICILYSSIFSYVLFYNEIKNYLAPQMHIYIKLSIIPVLIIGLVLIINKKCIYKFKVSDLILILPLIALLISSDGKLSTSLAKNRITNYKSESRTKIDVEEKNEVEEVLEEDYDFSDPYFDITDEIYYEISNYITFAAQASKYQNKTIKVKGFVVKDAPYLQKGYYALGKYAVSCCTADAGFTGFIVKNTDFKVSNNKWYEIEGVLKRGKDADSYDIMYIDVVNIKEIDSKGEDQYAYSCYAKGNGTCEALENYNLEY